MVHILIFPVRKSSKTVVVSGDIDTPIIFPMRTPSKAVGLSGDVDTPIIFSVRTPSKTVGLPGDVDTPIRVPGTEVDNIHRIIGDGLRAELC